MHPPNRCYFAAVSQSRSAKPPPGGVQPRLPARLRDGLAQLLHELYPDGDTSALIDAVAGAFWDGSDKPRRRARLPGNSLWSERDVYAICYGNSFIDGEHKPLDLLYDFLSRYLRGAINGVHILPYFPYTSDDGFAVTDYRAVDTRLGAWEDIERIGERFCLMSDLVLNHCSSQGAWFNGWRQGHDAYADFFVTADPAADLSQVVRPRTHPLLREVDTARGREHVWCTFSHDQVDLNYANPEVLLEMLRVMRFHIQRGVRTFRLDAVAFLWKIPGTRCIHLPQTHAVVRLMRLLADFCVEPLVLITETNVPNFENLSYFGNRNEAHAIYNFALPPLVLHALYNGDSRYLGAWQMAMPPAQLGCAYFNFTASHDGIGLRPAEGLIPEAELKAMIETACGFGGLLSQRALPDGSEHPYELNVTLFDALQGTSNGPDQWQVERFLCSQAIALALEGIPAIYIHSLLGTGNDHDGVARTGHNRAINRHRWHHPDLVRRLDDPDTVQARVFSAMLHLLRVRIRQPAFHPNATQFTLQLGEQLFGFWRQSLDRAQSIFALHNLCNQPVDVPTLSLNLIGGSHWRDLLSDDVIDPHGETIHFTPYQCRWITNR